MNRVKQNMYANAPSYCFLFTNFSRNAEQLLFEILNYNEKKRSQRRKHCTEPKNFAPPQTPFPEAQDGQNLISWRRSVPLLTNPVWWGSMHAISSYRGNRPTNTQTHKQTQTGPITIHCAAAS